MKRNLLVIPMLSLFAFNSTCLHAEVKKYNMNTKVFRLSLGASRLVYKPNSSGSAVSVSNPQEYPILVQGNVLNEDKKTAAPFIVTPPISRLDAKQRNKLRIIQTGGAIGGQEKLYWLCVSGIPPKDTDVWAQTPEGRQNPNISTINMEVSTRECVKLFLRPSDIKGSPIDSAQSLQWHKQGNKLTVNNPTPFYMNLFSVTVGGRKISDINYIPPRGSQTFNLPNSAIGPVRWRIITDEGGESHEFLSQ